MDFFGNRESNENFVMGLYFSILKFFGVILYFGLFYFSCFSPIAQTKETETEIESKQEILSGEPDHHSSLLRHPKNKVRVHHIFEEVYPSSSASSVSILAEKTTKSKLLHSKGGHFLEKILITLGYGIVLNPQGYILTNAHVIGTYDHLLVKSKSGKSYEAVIIGQDKKIDLAILQVTPDEDIIPVEKLDYYTLQRGEAAIRKYINAKIQIKKNRESTQPKSKNRTSDL
ncbi:trypsin-like peptidase domain-containing protein [Leptospira borgpetersenii]|uniref:trypsin-like peptidase domain-containing protein n=1 Tax=Leptospira borgpetersenii TaxID=174 RepID=UPI0007731A30|nr:trypsin-like peptidase domain-containing protein [Leptospira borgpetersenii]MBE8363319.1 trypsin-like peptidase domain-containing protein [Leptospira borgpetersenii serovar Balcanica]MBE8367914.1 trypsin-like peptidase domain-containing protein [Leptospira borgpetersenii serovar Balcanica]MBE8422367.1 trypsin-like peptidase domain-containing protein [Leptospira borgpetersenii serovar Balcanica]MBF3349521.1 trypsin-like peptidase domain-containing protein [Leptospira borgpetersenii serovar Ba